MLIPAGGDHSLAFFGMDATKNDGRVRLVRRSPAEADYLAVLQSMGVKLGPSTASLVPGGRILLALLSPRAVSAAVWIPMGPEAISPMATS